MAATKAAATTASEPSVPVASHAEEPTRLPATDEPVASADSSEEPEIVAVGTVSHVIRRAFHQLFVGQGAVEAVATTAPQPATESTELSQSFSGDDDDCAVSESVALQIHPYVALGNARKQLLRDSVALTRSTAGRLLALLDERHSVAAAADDAIAADLARQGLVVGAQIPMGPSNLQLGLPEVECFGAFSSTLVHANELVRDYHKNRLDRTGNGPSFLVRKAAGVTREPPGYLATTSAYNIHKETTLTMHQHHIDAVKTSATTTGSSAPQSPLQAPTENDNAHESVRFASADEPQQMSAHERRNNMAILERMQKKLDYLRNPRYTVASAATNEADSSVETQPSFVAVPSPVEFTIYDTGGVYEQVCYLRNTSSLSRRVRVLPPATLFFSVTEVAFPDASGLVAPGMHVQVRLRFAPDSRADYKDALTVQYEGANGGHAEQLSLPILAHRKPPELSIPLLLRAQPTLVGSQSITTFRCNNTGGRARFWLMTEADWARCEATTTFRSDGATAAVLTEFLGQGGLRVGPFTLTPNEMELDLGQSVDLQLTFLSSGIGEMREKFVMVCDNCLVRVFQLVGRGCQVDVSIAGVNAHPIDTSVANMGKFTQLAFAREMLLNATAAQTFTVLNDTPIDLQFEWRLETDTAHATESSVCPFGVTPASGVLQLSSVAAFSVAFSPPSARRYSEWRLVLYINNVPLCSIPGPNQLALLHETCQQLREAQQRQKLGGPLEALTAAEPAVESMRIALYGSGRLGSFHLQPTTVMISSANADGLAIAQSYRVCTQFQNDCDARVRVRWDPSRARLAGPQHSSAQKYFDLFVATKEHELAPRGFVDAEIHITLRAVGAFAIVVPCAIIDPSSRATVERWLRVEGRVARPQLRIVSPEIDFGLVLVSASADATLVIRNDSTVVAGDWTLTQLDAPGSAAVGSGAVNSVTDAAGALTSRTLRRSSSKDSVISHGSAASSSGRQSTRSSTSSLALFTTRDLAPRAVVAFHPPSGQLAPGETAQIRVSCQSGSLAERFLGTFSLTPPKINAPPLVFPGNAPLDHRPSCVSARAEIQSPNVVLSPLRLALGTTFLGVAVERVVQLANLSNLEAEFKFMEPQGASKACSIEFFPKQGVLRSKETLAVRLVYTARQAGKTTTLLACSAKGLAGPLGLEVVSTHKGLVLTYDALAATDRVPMPPHEVARARGVSVAEGNFEPDGGKAHSPPRLHFGDEIPLTQRRSLRLVIRNFSGINAQLELEPKRYSAAATSSTASRPSRLPGDSCMLARCTRGASGDSPSMSSPMSERPRFTSKSSRRKPLLSDEQDAAKRFQSDSGQAYIREQNHAAQDRELLRDGRGVAFLVSQAQGDGDAPLQPTRVLRIPPWEQAVVTVMCFNNMPGAFSEVLSCRAVGLPPVLLPMQATVVGTPLVLDANCVGLRLGPRLATPSFSFGHVCVRSPAITKTLRVINRGPRAATLKWKLARPGREHQLVHVSLRVDFAARVRLRIAAVADSGDADFPFELVPSQSLAPPFSSTIVNVTFFPTHASTAARVMLLADAHWIDGIGVDHDDGIHLATIRAPSSVELVTTDAGASPTTRDPTDARCEPMPLASPRVTTAAGKAIQAVRVANSLARTHTPTTSKLGGSSTHSISAQCIRVLLVANVVEPELTLDQPRRLGQPYHIKFTTWSTLLDGSATAWNCASHRQELSLVNRLNARVTFRLESTGPFAVTRAESLAPRHPLASSDLPPAHRRADGESFLFTLPPQMSVRLEMRVDAAKLAAALSETNAEPSRLVRRVEGELLVRLTNQSVQTIRLVGEVLRPMVVASPSVHSFGRVHLSRSRSVILRVANPTRVPAAFAVRHVPLPTPLTCAQKQEVATHHAQFTDEPAVFSFSAMSAVVRGPTVSLRSAGGAPQPATNSCQDLLVGSDADARVVFAPVEICVMFQPKERGKRYKSRFRLCVERGVDFEVVFEGQGHLDEVEYGDQERPIVRASELTHRNLIYKTLTPVVAAPTEQ